MDDGDEARYEKSLQDHLAMLRRRWRAALVATVAVAATGAGVAVLWPPTYRSTATILIEQQEIPEDLVRSTITSFADQRIQIINQRVMTTANLLEIIREHGLYAERFEREPREAIIERMRRDIHLDLISADVVDPRSGRPTEATIAFTVAYDNRSPQLATRVANELTSLYLQENSETRRQQAQEASAFLTDEAARLSGEIATLESRLAEFKKANVDRLPELTQLNLQLQTRTEQELADVRRQRNSIEERRAYLEAQLAQMSPNTALVSAGGQVVLEPAERLRSLEAQLVALRGSYKADHPDVVRTEKTIDALRKELGVEPEAGAELEGELETLRAQRTALLERYQPLHPDVVRLDRRIEALEAELESAPAEQEGVSSPAPRRADNPAYVQLQAQLASDAVELAALDDKERDLRTKLAAIDERLAETPSVEAEYDALARDLDNARLKYRDVSAKQMEAVTAENLEMDSKAERFTLIEPPLLPQRPISPNRGLIFFFGLVLAIGSGLGIVVLREAVDASVSGPRELQWLTGTVPLGVIPAIVTRDDLRQRARRRRRAAATAAAALLLLVGLAHFFVAPLDALWFAALRRFGI